MEKFLLLLIGCMLNLTGFAAGFTLKSSAFKNNTLIPNKYSCYGENKVPPLSWRNAPANTLSYALVVKDPDAPAGLWTHWIIFNIPTNINQINSDNPIPPGASVGLNSWNKAQYGGPCPSLGMHRYIFTLYALDTDLGLANGAQKNVILDAITSHVIGSAQLTGLYQKI